MNKLTLLALLGTVDACWFKDMMHIFHHGHHGHHHNHHVFHQSKDCQIPDEEFLPIHEIARQIAQKSYIQSVRGMYHEQYDPISDECFGDWFEPIFRNVLNRSRQFREDWDQISADEMKETTDLVIDGIYRNHKACQFEKVGDIWKHWCLNNMDTCLMKDGKIWDRIQEHGLDFIGIGYKLFEILMNHDSCATDEQRIKEIADVVEDLSSAAVMIHGFEEAWDPKEIDHVTRKEFKKEINEYKEQLKEAAEEKMKEMQEAMPKMPEFQAPSFELFGQKQEEHDHHHHHHKHQDGFGWGQMQETQFDFKNFHLF